MQVTDSWPISLAISREDERLSVALTDSRSVARFARVEVSAQLLEAICARAALILQSANGGGRQSNASDEAAKRLRDLGTDIFRGLLPEAVRAYLVQRPARVLYLLLSESLVAIPWELAFDGTTYLGEKFRVSRQVILDEETPPPLPARPSRAALKVLIVTGGTGTDADDAGAADLLARLGAVEKLSAQRVRTGDLRRSDIQHLIGDSDVVHYIGPVSGRPGMGGDVDWWEEGEPVSLRRIATQPYPPRLLVSTDTARGPAAPARPAEKLSLIKAACRSGLSLLVCDVAAAGNGGAGFMQEVYRELARGTALGEAVRRARDTARRRGTGENARYQAGELYGDAALVPFPTAGRGRQEDHIRQVTILAYDLVNSTGLIEKRGAEEYSGLLASYHERCASIVTRRGGQPDAPQGDDGIMCYFGFPTAHEDSAAQAVRAALEIVDAVAELALKVRIGIATGKVVVKEGQPHGKPIHLAARLRGIARPGTVIVAESTRRIVKNRFAFQKPGKARKLKGFGPGTLVHRLLAEVTDQLDAKSRPTPFVGRQRELLRIEEQWAAARGGELRTVLVSGEPGMGKSRLVREFRRSVSLASQQTVECRCAQERVTSAYHPLIDFIRRLLRIQDGDSVESKLDRIDAIMAAGSPVESAAQLVAALLSVPFESRHAPLPHSPERKRQLTLDVLVNWVVRETKKAPICLIFEDIQWIDPSSREFLSRLIAAGARLPLLILATERVDPQQPRNHGITGCEIELKGLPRDAVRKMILGVRGASAIPNHFVRLLADKADGVPLFIEESTRMVVDRRASSESGGSLSAFNFRVPSELDDLLMQRVDQFATAKPVAQLGGTLGREFSLELLEAVARESLPVKIDNLRAGLGTLIDAGLLVEKGEAPNTSYYFKHALVRDAAYQSLLESHRGSIHRAVAVVVAERFPDLTRSQPELLAYHYTQAGNDAEAVLYWERAARLAASRSAHAEAISHLTSGLGLVARLPGPAERADTELKLQLLLARHLIATEGYGADQVGRVYHRASDLSRRIGDEDSMMKAQFGLEGYHFMRADFDQAYAIAVQAAAAVARSPDTMRRLQSMWAVANILFHQGELASAVERMDACLDEYYRMQHYPAAVQDPGVMCLCYSAWGKWQLGHPDQAIARAKKVIELSEKLSHRFSIGEAYGFCTSVHHFRGENEEALRCAEHAIEICEDSGFAVWLAHAKLMHGRIVAERGETAAGIEEMREAYGMWAATGAVVTTPFYLAMQAEGLALAGRPDDGLALLRRAYDIVCRYKERYYEAEVMRLIGELTLQAAALRGRNGGDEAERWFLGALDSARERQLNSMTLRSATSLARLRIAQGRSAEAVRMLAPAYARFDEGMDTRDVRAAGALLEQLRLAHVSA